MGMSISKLLRIPLALSPLNGLGWVCLFGVSIQFAGTESPRYWVTIATGAGFQVLAVCTFSTLASFCHSELSFWWRVCSAACVYPATILTICITIGFAQGIQFITMSIAAALVIFYAFLFTGVLGALVAVGISAITWFLMMLIFNICYWLIAN